MSDELKLKLSLAKKGKTFSDEHRANLSKSHKGKMPSNIETFKMSRKGYKMTAEEKIKHSQCLKGKPQVYKSADSREMSLKNLCTTSWNKGKGVMYRYTCTQCKQPFETSQRGRKYCSLKCSHQTNSGDVHYRWVHNRFLLKLQAERGGTRHKQWSLAVKARDKRICFFLDGCEGRLESHHLKSWKEYPLSRYDLDNGITLCHKHHMEVEHHGLKVNKLS